MRATIGLFVLLLTILSCQPKNIIKYQRDSDFNFNWKFTLVQDTALPNKLPLDDAEWSDIRLPHDWSVEASFDSTLEGCTGYLPGGVGIYQKHFETPASPDHKSIYVLFDGVYNNATFWLNGKLLGKNPYGYSPSYFDLTDKLTTDGSMNVLTVHVDHSRYADSRWYTGSGIYRNVKLVTLNKLHIPIWGTYLTTPIIEEDKAIIHLETKVVNQLSTEKVDFTLSTKILDADGNQVTSNTSDFTIESDKQAFEQELVVANPNLWNCDNPHLYRAITTLEKNGEIVDEYTTSFGIRDFKFEAGKGFFLNGEPTLVKGVCLHHDGGLVGAAVPKGVWRRRLQLLKEGGVNAIRTAHNPYSEEFLDLCDEMGIIVQHELFDEFDYAKDKRWNYHDRNTDYITRGYDMHFQEWAKSDLTRTILRDRNHPSIFQWSIGNEIEWTYLSYRYITGFWTDPNEPQKSGGYWSNPPLFSPEELKQRYDNWDKEDYILTETAIKLNTWVKELDTSRVTTTNCVIPHVSMVSGYADAVDIVGYSYRNIEFPWAHKHFPNKQITINECPGSWNDWKTVLQHPGVYSIFMWTGISYMGEADGDWPNKDSGGDMLDLAGFKRQGWNYFKSVFVNQPHISLGTRQLKKSQFKFNPITEELEPKRGNAYRWSNTNMHWNYKESDSIIVEVCSNYSTVELKLNGRSLGYKSMSDFPDRIFRWMVPFEEGTLTALAGFEGEEVVAELSTAGSPVNLDISIDKSTLTADAYDVAHLIVQLTDNKGIPVKTENAKIKFSVNGNAKLLGLDNGASDNTQNFQSNSIVTAKGRCLAILQSTKNKGNITIEVSSDGYKTETLMIKTE